MTRYSLLTLITAAAIIAPTALAFTARPQLPQTPHSSSVAYRTSTDSDIDTASSAAASTKSAAVSLSSADSPFLWEDKNDQDDSNHYHNNNNNNGHQHPQLPMAAVVAQRLEEDKDPALVEFLPAEVFHMDVSSPMPSATKSQECLIDESMCDDDHYPFAAMLQGSAPYIASHLGETVVFYIPGEWLHKPNKLFDSFLQDVALSRLMGMKMVLVADCRMDEVDAQYCATGNDDDDDSRGSEFEYAHECHNALRPTSAHTIRKIEEEAGFIRFEVERKMNRFLRRTLVGGSDEEGNVLGGNYYMGRKFGTVRGEDFEHTGFVSKVYTDNIQQALDRNDIVLLTTVGSSKDGDSVNVNGHHLAATVAASLKAYKLIYMSNQGAVLSQKNKNNKSQEPPKKKFYQEIPLSFAKSLTDYYKVKAHKTGFANFEYARQTLEPRAVELLLNLAWSSWALEQGVSRAHVVNPKDGAVLEELFTSKNGANTCLYHDDENLQDEDDMDWLSEDDAEDWNDFFAEAASQERVVNGDSSK